MTVTRSDSVVQTFETTDTTYTISGLPTGVTATATVTTLNPNNTSVASTPTGSSSQTVSLVSTADNDGDGMNNASEVAAGTSPLDATSIFKVNSIAAETGGAITITWSAVAGKTYYVESKSNLASGTWTTISGALTPGTTTGTYTDPVPGAGNKFYRVKVGP